MTVQSSKPIPSQKRYTLAKKNGHVCTEKIISPKSYTLTYRQQSDNKFLTPSVLTFEFRASVVLFETKDCISEY